jgi:hypothetical protein
VRAAQLAHQSPDRLAPRGRLEVELTGLGRPGEIAGFALFAGFQTSTEAVGGQAGIQVATEENGMEQSVEKIAEQLRARLDSR